jgi:hypothetical protein
MIAGSAVIVNIMAIAMPDMWVVKGTDNAAVAATANMVTKLLRHIFAQTAAPNIVMFSTGLVLVIGGIVLGIILRPKMVAETAPVEEEALPEIVEAEAEEELTAVTE